MKKLKQQYRNHIIRFDGPFLWNVYPCVRSRTFKRFSTKQEKSYFFLHEVEYREYPIKLRAARGKSLANPWDDYPAYVDKVAKCWKHNSKRRHQYYK